MKSVDADAKREKPEQRTEKTERTRMASLVIVALRD